MWKIKLLTRPEGQVKVELPTRAKIDEAATTISFDAQFDMADVPYLGQVQLLRNDIIMQSCDFIRSPDTPDRSGWGLSNNTFTPVFRWETVDLNPMPHATRVENF